MLPVLSVNHGASIELVTPEATIKAGKLVLAVDGLLPAFGFMRNRLINLGLWASITRELNDDELKSLGSENNWGMTPADARGGITMRLLASRRLLLRAITYPEQNYRPHTPDLPRVRDDPPTYTGTPFPSARPDRDRAYLDRFRVQELECSARLRRACAQYLFGLRPQWRRHGARDLSG